MHGNSPHDVVCGSKDSISPQFILGNSCPNTPQRNPQLYIPGGVEGSWECGSGRSLKMVTQVQVPTMHVYDPTSTGEGMSYLQNAPVCTLCSLIEKKGVRVPIASAVML